MRVLGINISHDASISVVEDGKVVSFYEEARFNKQKHYEARISDSPMHLFQSIDKKIDISTIDKVVFTCTDQRFGVGPDKDKAVMDRVSKEIGVDSYVYKINHHLHHAYCAAYFSPFEEAICLVLDGGGALMNYEDFPTHQEIESVYHITKGTSIKPKYRHISDVRRGGISPTYYSIIEGVDVKVSAEYSSGMLFTELCNTIDLGSDSSGKLMGLAPYGAYDMTNNRKRYQAECLAYELQNSTFQHTVKLIEKAMKYSSTKNLILSGGYALNCTNNYKYTEHFSDLNIFIDPNAYDAGTAIGAALWGYYDNK